MFVCFFFYKFIYYLFIYLWLCWVFVSVRGLSLVAASGGHSSSRCAGLSLSRPLLLRSTGSRRVGSVVVAHGPSCSAVCGIFLDQGSNPCPLHWQADSQPLHHQGNPSHVLICSRNGCSVDADCYNESNALHTYESSYFSRHLHPLILSRQSQNRRLPLLLWGFGPAPEPLYSLVSSSVKWR